MTDRSKAKPQQAGGVTGKAGKPANNSGKAPSASAAVAAEVAAEQQGRQSQMAPETAKQLATLRSSVRENFGKAAMALMMLPRYRNQSIGDLQHIVLEPLLRDRLAMAFPAKPDAAADTPREMLGFAIWASVSTEVDARIREQVKAGNFPVRLKPEDWNSGDINWLLDVIAPDEKSTLSVIANFRQVAKEGQLVIHPVITRLVDKQSLEKLGAVKSSQTDGASGADAVGAQRATVN